MGLTSNLREKCLLVKEKWAIVLTPIAQVCYRFKLLMPTFFSTPFVFCRPAAPMCVCAWRWYRGSTGEASA